MATKVRIRRKPEQKAKRQIKGMLDSLGICWTNVAGGPGGTNGAPDMIVCYKGLPRRGQNGARQAVRRAEGVPSHVGRFRRYLYDC